jgi:hypothetical protein
VSCNILKITNVPRNSEQLLHKLIARLIRDF